MTNQSVCIVKETPIVRKLDFVEKTLGLYRNFTLIRIFGMKLNGAYKFLPCTNFIIKSLKKHS